MSALLRAIDNVPDCTVYSVHYQYCEQHVKPLQASFEGWHIQIGLVTRCQGFRLAPYLRSALIGHAIVADILEESKEPEGDHDVIILVGPVNDIQSLDPDAATAEVAESMLAAARRLSDRTRSSKVYCLPAPPKFTSDGKGNCFNSEPGFVGRIQQRLRDGGGEVTEQLSDLFDCVNQPAQDTFRAWRYTGIPWTEHTYWEIGRVLANRIRKELFPQVKCIVLDGDDTLWEGVAGEENAKPVLRPQHRELHQALRSFRSVGTLLALCSKNNEGDTRDVCDSLGPESLAWSDFSAIRVNWEPKDANLRSIASELKIDTSQMVFVDDNPRECESLHRAVPEVLIVNAGSMETRRAVECLRSISRTDVITDEDRSRATFYQQTCHRAQLRDETPQREDFVRNLGLRISSEELQAQDSARCSQLTMRANQFNVTNTRLSIDEVGELVKCANGFTLTTRVSDRFGDFGLVGMLSCMIDGPICTISAFVLSCRAIGLNIELAMLKRLAEAVKTRGLSVIRASLVRTERNGPCWDVFERAGFAKRDNEDWELRLASDTSVQA
jgi:FkbH-like protein